MKFLVQCKQVYQDPSLGQQTFEETVLEGVFYADTKDQALADAEDEWAEKLDDWNSRRIPWELFATEDWG